MSLPESLRRSAPRGPASLRVRLQAANVLTVVVCYTALVSLALSLDRISRRQQHQPLVDRISSSPPLPGRSLPRCRRCCKPETELQLLPTGREQPRRLRWHGQHALLESISRLTKRVST